MSPRRLVVTPGNGRGFTLLEVLFVLFIVGILLAIAIPAYRQYIEKTRLAGHAQFVLETIRLARIEVITREIPVSLCASSNGAACTGGPWENGWIVFADADIAGIVDGNDGVLRAVPKYPAGTTVEVTVTDDSGLDYILLTPGNIYLVDAAPAKPAGFIAVAARWTETILLSATGIGDALAASDDKKGKDDKDKKQKKKHAEFKFCSSFLTAETGQLVTIHKDGSATIMQITCD